MLSIESVILSIAELNIASKLEDLRMYYFEKLYESLYSNKLCFEKFVFLCYTVSEGRVKPVVITNDEQSSSIWCSVASTSTEHFNFAEPEHVLEHLTLEHRARALSTWP